MKCIKSFSFDPSIFNTFRAPSKADETGFDFHDQRRWALAVHVSLPGDRKIYPERQIRGHNRRTPFPAGFHAYRESAVPSEQQRVPFCGIRRIQ